MFRRERHRHNARFDPAGGHIRIEFSGKDFDERDGVFFTCDDDGIGSFINADGNRFEQRFSDEAAGDALQVGSGNLGQVFALGEQVIHDAGELFRGDVLKWEQLHGDSTGNWKCIKEADEFGDGVGVLGC